ncbi:hypothetical protein Dimus_004464, partial [Dionaea muscipula]
DFDGGILMEGCFLMWNVSSVSGMLNLLIIYCLCAALCGGWLPPFDEAEAEAAASSRWNWWDWMVKVMRGKTGLARDRRKWPAAMLYGIWQERNARIFTDCTASPPAVLRRVESSC